MVSDGAESWVFGMQYFELLQLQSATSSCMMLLLLLSMGAGMAECTCMAEHGKNSPLMANTPAEVQLDELRVAYILPMDTEHGKSSPLMADTPAKVRPDKLQLAYRLLMDTVIAEEILHGVTFAATSTLRPFTFALP